MAQADGTIYIDTAINADGMKPGGKAVEAAARRMAKEVSGIGASAKVALREQAESFVRQNRLYAQQEQKIEGIKARLAELREQKVPTTEFKKIGEQIEKDEKSLNNLIKAQKEFTDAGGDRESPYYQNLVQEVERLKNRIQSAKTAQEEMIRSGRAYTGQTIDGTGTKEYQDALRELAAEEARLQESGNRLGAAWQKLKWKVEAYGGSVSRLDSMKKRLNKTLLAMVGNLKRGAAAMFKMDRQTKKTNGSFLKNLKTILKYTLGIRSLYVLFNRIRNAVKQGFSNLAQYSGETNRSISSLMSALTQLKNSLATAFNPILTVVSPALTKLINLLSKAATYAGMFFAAAFTGKKTFVKAVAVQQDYAAGLKDSASAAKEAEKATDSYLSGLDEVRRFETKDDTNKDTGAGSGELSPADMFETVPIENSIAELAQKVRDLFGKIFEPFRQAWELEGKNTIEAAEYAFSSLKTLVESVGASLMEVWTNGTGTKTVTLLLEILQNVLLTVGHIADRLNEAWNTGGIGTQIIQNLFDLFNVILETIREITGATAEWAATLDFAPLLQSINGLLEALKPLTENIGAGLAWFWENVLLPIAGWTIQEAVPAFLDLLSAAIGTVNEVIEALKPLAGWLFDTFLKPLGEWTGDLVIAALKTLTDLLSRFGDWISEHQGIVEAFTVVIGSFMAAWGIVNLAVTIGGIISALVSFITTGGLATAVMTALGGAIAFLTSPITIAIAAITAIIAAGILLAKNWNAVSAKAKELWDFVKQQFEAFDRWLGGVFSTDWEYWFGIFGGVIGGFMKNVENIWNGIKEIFEGITTFISGVFSGDWEKAWEGVKQIFKGVFDSLIAIAKTPINTIIGFINSLISGVSTAVNKVIDMLNGLSFEAPDWVPIIGGKSLDLNIPKISPVKIPYLATGAVIPPNAPFLAMMGEQKHGTNLEAPESLIRKIVREESGRNQQNGGTTVLKLYLDGKQIAEAVVKQGKLEQMASGRNMFALG